MGERAGLGHPRRHRPTPDRARAGSLRGRAGAEAEGHAWRGVGGGEEGFGAGAEGGAGLLDGPGRPAGLEGEALVGGHVGPGEGLAVLGEAAQHGVHEAGGALADHRPREVDRGRDGSEARGCTQQQLVGADAQDVAHGRVDLLERAVHGVLQCPVQRALPAECREREVRGEGAVALVQPGGVERLLDRGPRPHAAVGHTANGPPRRAPRRQPCRSCPLGTRHGAKPAARHQVRSSIPSVFRGKPGMKGGLGGRSGVSRERRRRGGGRSRTRGRPCGACRQAGRRRGGRSRLRSRRGGRGRGRRGPCRAGRGGPRQGRG